jgi:glutamate racemase
MDFLVLGCTHYAFVASELAELVGEQTAMLEGGVPVARQTWRLLEPTLRDAAGASLTADASTAQATAFYSTGTLALLDSAIHRWLHSDVKTLPLDLR